jgi:hypothetical protein
MAKNHDIELQGASFGAVPAHPMVLSDCPHCVFVASIQHNGSQLDLYLHRDQKYTTLVAVYGDEDGDYQTLWSEYRK